MYRNICKLMIPLLFFLSLCGCSGEDTLKAPEPGSGLRGSTIQILESSADGILTCENDLVALDASNTDQGYIMLKWLKEQHKIKLQVTGPTNITYTYNVPSDGQWHTFPLTEGSGKYQLNVFENVYEDQYSQVFTDSVNVLLSSEQLPFLYPNEYVNFNELTQAVQIASVLSESADDDIDVISYIFYYVVTNISYDYEKASTVRSGYIPDVDETLQSGKGICFDYAALMACMLRSQKIPTRLDIGYIGDVYHAWISTWVEDQGWVYNIIEFDGTSWNMMDPTFTSESRGADLTSYINNDDSYFVKYSY